MREYKCLKSLTDKVCKGTMKRVRTTHKGKQRFVCSQCHREGWWWELADPRSSQPSSHSEDTTSES